MQQEFETRKLADIAPDTKKHSASPKLGSGDDKAESKPNKPATSTASDKFSMDDSNLNQSLRQERMIGNDGDEITEKNQNLKSSKKQIGEN